MVAFINDDQVGSVQAEELVVERQKEDVVNHDENIVLFNNVFPFFSLPEVNLVVSTK